MITGTEQLLWVWYDIELMKTHLHDVDKINMSIEIEREFNLTMHAYKTTRIDETSIEY